MARRPLAGFLVIALGPSWLLFRIPVFASMGSFPAPSCRWRFRADVDAVDLAADRLVVTSSPMDGPGCGRCLPRVFRWRFGIGWWLVVLFGLPVIALLLGLIFGGSLQTADLGPVLITSSSPRIDTIIAIDLVGERLKRAFPRHPSLDLREYEDDLPDVVRELTGGRVRTGCSTRLGIEADGSSGQHSHGASRRICLMRRPSR